MNWKFTVILHGPRKALGISVLEYSVYDYIYKSQTHPDFSFKGWCKASHRKIASELGISEGTVFGIIARGVEWGLCDVDPANPGHKRTLEKWYNAAYLDESALDGAEIEPVQKMNVQNLNGGVQKMNGKCSESEQKRSFSERLYIISNKEGNLKETADVRIIDEAVAIVNFFNEVSGRKVSANVKGRGSENVMMVAQLLRKGYTREELEQMIVFKCWEWKDSPKMAKHLEPVTIFKRHGAQYIQQAIEARENPAFLAVLKRAHDAEGKNQPITNGEITRAVAERLLNW